jgi:hypothetical protein
MWDCHITWFVAYRWLPILCVVNGMTCQCHNKCYMILPWDLKRKRPWIGGSTHSNFFCAINNVHNNGKGDYSNTKSQYKKGVSTTCFCSNWPLKCKC